MADSMACELADGRRPLPGGRIFKADYWLVEHCVGPLGLGTLIVKPERHLTSVASLSPDEAAELGPLLRCASVVAERLVSADRPTTAWGRTLVACPCLFTTWCSQSPRNRWWSSRHTARPCSWPWCLAVTCRGNRRSSVLPTRLGGRSCPSKGQDADLPIGATAFGAAPHGSWCAVGSGNMRV